MALELKQQIKLAQQLVMTPQLQQAIKLLQLSRLELAETVQQEIEQNPLLEEDSLAPESGESSEVGEFGVEMQPEETATTSDYTQEVNIVENSDRPMDEINWADYDNEYEGGASFKYGEESDLPSRFELLTKKTNLLSHMQWQLSFSDYSEEEMVVGDFLIGNLNRDGYLDATEEDIIRETGCDAAMAKKMIASVQSMDPPGICARDVKECLLLQLARIGLTHSLASTIVKNYLHFLETKNYAAIVRATGHSLEHVLSAVKVITGLDPHPGRQYSEEEPQYITPDVYIHKMGDEYVIMLNDEGLPRLRISTYYKEILKGKDKGSDSSTKEYIQDKLKSAVWLIKSIHQRQRTIYRVVESILKFQRDFFENGVSYLRPLILRDVAEDLGMHESTISRVTSNKYVHTPQGTFELKYFFNTAIERRDGGEAMASESIRGRLRAIIQSEDPENPLCDKALADIFKKEDIKLARRTVAKYREQLGILPSKLRKRPKLR